MSKMPKNKKTNQDYIPLLYARNLEEAEYYLELLEEHEIPVMIDEERTEMADPSGKEPGIPVLVPDDHLDEAEAIIDEEESLDEVFGNDEDEEEEEESSDTYDSDEDEEEDEEDGDEVTLLDDEEEDGPEEAEEDKF
jgi:hypothetical protein